MGLLWTFGRVCVSAPERRDEEGGGDGREEVLGGGEWSTPEADNVAGRGLVPLKQIKEGAKAMACKEGRKHFEWQMLEASCVKYVIVISQAYNTIMGRITWSGVEENGTGCI